MDCTWMQDLACVSWMHLLFLTIGFGLLNAMLVFFRKTVFDWGLKSYENYELLQCLDIIPGRCGCEEKVNWFIFEVILVTPCAWILLTCFIFGILKVVSRLHEFQLISPYTIPQETCKKMRPTHSNGKSSEIQSEASDNPVTKCPECIR